MYEYRQRPHNFFLYFLIAILSFIFGWQATSLGWIAGLTEVGDKIINNATDPDSPLKSDEDGENKGDLSLFWTVWDELELNYVDVEAIKPDNMVYGAIKGMVDSLEDPYTVFMTPQESEEFSSNLEGKLEGIGAELTVEDHNLVIVSPLRDSPAEKAGLLPGDIIFKIEGEIASDLTLFDAIMKIRGEKGTAVELTMIREGLDDPFDVSIIRDSIDIDSVTMEDAGDGITYLSINQFNDKTIEQLKESVSKMLENKPMGVIVDLRFNGGGYLDTAVDMLSYFLPSHTAAVKIQQRNKDDATMYTNGNPKLLDVPMVVLVNEGSASASEIFAGAIQDHDRGVVMGTTTFGKGSVQEVESFSDGSSIRITIAKWLTPDGRTVNHVGLEPEIVVEISDEDIKNEYDAQKEAAIEYLKNL